MTADEDAGGGESEGTCLPLNEASDRPILVPPLETQRGLEQPKLQQLALPILKTPPFSIRPGDPSPIEKFVLSIDRLDASAQKQGQWLCGGDLRVGTFEVKVQEYEHGSGGLRARVVVDAECPVDTRNNPVALGGRVKVHLEFVARPEADDA